MRIGYGYKRHRKNFRPHDCERVFIDDTTTNRQERLDLVELLGNLHENDALVLLKRGDIGGGQEIPKLLAEIEALNVTIEVIGDAPRRETRGRPKLFDPDPDQEKKLRPLWHGIQPLYHVLQRASEVMGFDVKRHQLIYRFGNRWQQ